MKKSVSLLLALCILCSLCAVGFAETGAQRLELAFGLFSVALPEGAEIGAYTSSPLADCQIQLEVSPFTRPVMAGFAPLVDYENTARRELDSYISLVFALYMGADGYSETEIQEETLPGKSGGEIRLRWQLMHGKSSQALWFEAFSENYGYNMVLYGDASKAQDEIMLSVMRSFQVDPELERARMDLVQEKAADGSFVSVERGLRIRLDPTWNPAEIEDLLWPNTAYLLEKDDGRWLIQLLSTMPEPENGARDLLDWYVENRKAYFPDGAEFGEPYAIMLENLDDTEAWCVDEESGVFVRNIAFVYKGCGYFGSFMWIVPDDEEARPYMDAAIHSLSPAD